MTDCIEQYHPEIDNKNGFFDRYTDYQENSIDMAREMIQSNETFAQGFFRGLGIPIPIIGGLLEKEMGKHRGHIGAIGVGASEEQNIPGYEVNTVTIGGQEITIFTDATNPNGDPITLTVPNVSSNREFMERYGEELEDAKEQNSTTAAKERNAAIEADGIEGYKDTLHDFLNRGLPNTIAGYELIDEKCLTSASAETNNPADTQLASYDTMTEGAGNLEVLQTASMHIGVDPSALPDQSATPSTPTFTPASLTV